MKQSNMLYKLDYKLYSEVMYVLVYTVCVRLNKGKYMYWTVNVCQTGRREIYVPHSSKLNMCSGGGEKRNCQENLFH